MRWVLTFLAGLAALVLLAPLCFFGVVLLAGPHSSLVPSFLQPPVLVFAWGLFLIGPVLVARWAWRRMAHGPSDGADGVVE